ncbi:DNA gyrase inhibitor YacG [Propionivibrio soli]|uniref:DNA gyrase inhibitor YacG n=1 Tax=Propionivibrio soli TaxID=2976531 RepID=UPI0021E78EBA|nr:DNA gyrase inhibitor YacG [Propionivibrio soli]
MPRKPTKVRCPQCGGESEWSLANPYRPFCSERCKLIDLGAWASESYRLPEQEPNGPPPDEPGA